MAPTALVRPLERFWHARGTLLLVLGLLAFLPFWAASQPGSPAARLAFHVQPGPLVQVLQQIASQARVLIYFSPAVVAGQRSNGLEGHYSTQDALNTVLQEHQLEAYVDGAGNFSVRARLQSEIPILAASQTLANQSDSWVILNSRAGSKTLTSLMQQPQSVSVVSAAEIQARGARSVTQALGYTPGVQVDNYGGTEVRNDWIVLRGFDAKLTGDYRDGLSQMPYDQIRARVPAYALEQIEVVRGPVSALYGQAAPGGIVNRVTKRPVDTPLRELGLQYGSFAQRQAYLDLSGKLQEDGQALMRLTATARQGGTQDRYDSEHRYRDDMAYVAPAFSWRNADTSITVLLHYQHDRNDGESRVFYPTRVMVGDYDYDRNDRDFFSAAWLLEHRLNEHWRLRQNLRYQHGDMLLRNLYAGALAADGHSLSRVQLQAREQAEGVAMDNQLEGDFTAGGWRHRLLAGLDVRRLSGRQHYQQAAAPGLDLNAPRYGQGITLPGDAPSIIRLRQTSTQWGLYAQDQAQAGPWTVTLGARRDDYRELSSDRLSGADRLQRDVAHTWRAGLSFAAGAGVAPYVAYGTSFVPQLGSGFDGQPFKPSRARQLEAGVKIQPPQSQSLYTAAIFDLRQRDVLTADSDPLHPGFSAATGQVRARGLELEAKVSLSPAWDALGSYTFNAVKNLSAGDGSAGKSPIVTPRHMAAAWLSYRFGGRLAGWTAGAGLRYLGTTYVDAANTWKNDAATLVDGSVAYETGAWRLALDASNLFNRQTIVCRGSRSNCRYGVDRTVLASVMYRY